MASAEAVVVPTHTLTELEATIDAGLAARSSALDAIKGDLIGAAEALIEIRDSKLYKDTHANFRDYCASRWELTTNQVQGLLAYGPALESGIKPKSITEAKRINAEKNASKDVPRGRPKKEMPQPIEIIDVDPVDPSKVRTSVVDPAEGEVLLWFSTAEMASITKAAVAADLSIVAFCKQAVLGATGKPVKAAAPVKKAAPKKAAAKSEVVNPQVTTSFKKAKP